MSAQNIFKLPQSHSAGMNFHSDNLPLTFAYQPSTFNDSSSSSPIEDSASDDAEDAESAEDLENVSSKKSKNKKKSNKLRVSPPIQPNVNLDDAAITPTDMLKQCLEKRIQIYQEYNNNLIQLINELQARKPKIFFRSKNKGIAGVDPKYLIIENNASLIKGDIKLSHELIINLRNKLESLKEKNEILKKLWSQENRSIGQFKRHSNINSLNQNSQKKTEKQDESTAQAPPPSQINLIPSPILNSLPPPKDDYLQSSSSVTNMSVATSRSEMGRPKQDFTPLSFLTVPGDNQSDTEMSAVDELPSNFSHSQSMQQLDTSCSHSHSNSHSHSHSHLHSDVLSVADKLPEIEKTSDSEELPDAAPLSFSFHSQQSNSKMSSKPNKKRSVEVSTMDMDDAHEFLQTLFNKFKKARTEANAKANPQMTIIVINDNINDNRISDGSTDFLI